MAHKNSLRQILAVFLMLIPVIAVHSREISLVNTQTIDLSGISSLAIDYSSDDMVFKAGDTDQLILKEYFVRDDSKYHARISQTPGAVTIKSGKRPVFFSWIFWRRGRVEIYLPQTYKRDLLIELSSGSITSDIDFHDFETFQIELSSGSININNISAKNVNLKSSSGSITAKSIRALENVVVRISSGSVEAEDISAESINIRISSGQTTIESMEGDSTIRSSSGNIAIGNSRGRVNISASSGRIEIEDFSGNGTLHASSGKIDMGISALDNNLDIRTSSGGIRMNVPAEMSFNLDARIASGRVLVKSPDNTEIISAKGTVRAGVGNAPALTIAARTGSGGLTIQQRR